MNDTVRKQEEFDIRLDELFWSVLRRWRGIIIVTVIVAILLGGFGAVREFKAYRDPEARERAQSAYEEELEQYERSRESAEVKIDNLKKWIERQDNYKESSLFLLMDPYDVYKATLIYYVDSAYEIMPEMSYQNPNYTRTLVNSYSSAINRLPINDLIDLPDGQDLTTEHMVTGNNKKLCSVSTDPDNGLITVTVICDTDERGNVVIDAVKQTVNDCETMLNQVVGEHTVTQIGETIEHTIDMDIINLQTKFSTDYDNNVKELSKAEQALDELKVPVKTVHSRRTVMSKGVKFGCIGLIIGLFLSVFVYAVLTLTQRRIVSTYGLQRHFGLPVLAVINTNPEKGNRLDRWIASKLGFAHMEDKEASAAYAVSTVRLKAGDNRDLLVIGTADSEKTQEIARIISEKIPEINTTYAGDVCSAAGAVDGLVKGVPAICVEQWPASGYNDMERELQLLDISRNDCLGFILVV